MRTLEEVIDSITKQSGLEIRDVRKPEKDRFWVDRETYNDALHYLKEYKEKCHELDILVLENRRAFEQLGVETTRYQEAVKNCEAAENKYRKLAEETSQNLGNTSQKELLTWEELKTMLGKPVWVEVNGTKALHTSGWGIVGCTSFTTWEGVPCFSLVKVGVTYALPIKEYGKTWQAYRKEKTE